MDHDTDRNDLERFHAYLLLGSLVYWPCKPQKYACISLTCEALEAQPPKTQHEKDEDDEHAVNPQSGRRERNTGYALHALHVPE